MRTRSFLAAATLAMLAACASVADDRRPARASSTPSGRGFGFFVIGDTGVIGPEGNLAATSTMVRDLCATRFRCDFGLMSGDNIYPDGATGDPAKDAPTFDALFTRPFGTLWSRDRQPDARLYVALGNHDWYNGRAGAQAQVRFHETNAPFFMDGFFYQRRIAVRGQTIDLFVIDTEMLLSSEKLPSWKRDATGAMVRTDKTDRGGTEKALPVTPDERAQADWFGKAIARSTANWTIVLAHHPIWQGRADSKFAQSAKLRELLLPALCRHADAYFAGHQHTIEVATDDCSTVTGAPRVALPQIVSGAGAKARSIDPAFIAWQKQQFPQMQSAFAVGDAAGYVHVDAMDGVLTVTPVTSQTGGAVMVHPGMTFRKRIAR